MEKCIDSEAYKEMVVGLQLIQETAPAEDGIHLYLGKSAEPESYVFIRFFYADGQWQYNKEYEEQMVRAVSNSPERQGDT
jgi:hypothetical protein